MKLTQNLLLACAAAMLATACASQRSVTANPLKATIGQQVDLTKYQTATVVPFTQPSNCKYPYAGQEFAADIARRLRTDFGPLFKEVRTTTPAGQPDELIVTGNIKNYEPGSRAQRMMLIGTGVASFNADLVLRDAASQQDLLDAPINKLWAWGGILGASKGIEDMTAESAAAAAKTVAVHKHWQPGQK
jgi:hypothetical protein